jgi:hypothetical protein
MATKWELEEMDPIDGRCYRITLKHLLVGSREFNINTL